MSERRDSMFPVSKTIPVRDLIDHPELASVLTLAAGEGGLLRPISHPRIQKSGLILVGHAHGVVPSRVQVFGETEMTYLESLPSTDLRARLDQMFQLDLSLVVLTRGVTPMPELIAAATATDTPLAVAAGRSSRMIHVLHGILDRLLAPETVLHGGLVDVHGIGTLLLGPSGIGKSECALFLVETGHHRLVADDQVVVTRLPGGKLIGRAAPLLRHHLEVRGIGIINVRELFGATAVSEEKSIDLVVELCPWRDGEPYERLGLDEERYELLGLQLPMSRIPVRPGRNMAVILEVAARNQLMKREGYHSAREFTRRLSNALGLATDREDLP